MSDLVPAEAIERIVGRERHDTIHYARAVSAEERVYVLHPHECLAEHGNDLRDCPYSLALDAGIILSRWPEDQVTPVAVHGGRLWPCAEEPTS